MIEMDKNLNGEVLNSSKWSRKISCPWFSLKTMLLLLFVYW